MEVCCSSEFEPGFVLIAELGLMFSCEESARGPLFVFPCKQGASDSLLVLDFAMFAEFSVVAGSASTAEFGFTFWPVLSAELDITVASAGAVEFSSFLVSVLVFVSASALPLPKRKR